MGIWNAVMRRIDKANGKFIRSFGHDLTTPRGRRVARFHYHWIDHAILRYWWTNFAQIAPGVYRSNQPTHARFEVMKELGVKTVLNLRGEERLSHFQFEKESCDKLGLKMVNIRLHARKAKTGERYLEAINAMREIEKPFLIHCKSGADRAGLAAVLYLLAIEKRPIEEARKQLSLGHLHIRWTKTGILDHILDLYEARNEKSPIDIEEWFRTEYNRKAVQKSFDALPIWRR
ncbi:Tyrosine phosphatase family protein [Poseidonocella pacifica]|uniref:Tyrosine phosphatase family protein n=1 Tax=Poseidonocella pacifica TaxID=871651 RepID=A0A1I0XJU6_9RHOB|nr:tyrosine-protein phosphatase [Poseidonocella pacifica]SFB00213.1 Tyrosine phosphatase family protein [Poseidonocella pacifica]